MADTDIPCPTTQSRNGSGALVKALHGRGVRKRSATDRCRDVARRKPRLLLRLRVIHNLLVGREFLEGRVVEAFKTV